MTVPGPPLGQDFSGSTADATARKNPTDGDDLKDIEVIYTLPASAYAIATRNVQRRLRPTTERHSRSNRTRVSVIRAAAIAAVGDCGESAGIRPGPMLDFDGICVAG